MKPLLIIGASSFGRLIATLAEECGRPVAGFIDDTIDGPSILGNTHDLGTELQPLHYELALAIGYKHLQARLGQFIRLKEAGFHFPTLIHPTARISKHANLEEGSLVMGGADVDAFSEVGSVCVLWPRAVVSHDNRIGRNTFISPAATLCGFVTVGQSSFIGANSTIVDGSTLRENSFVKAASLHYSKNPAT